MNSEPVINRASLSEQAYEAIKVMIHRLELKPGQPVTEAKLSTMLNISKSPIRSALIHLQRDGLVTITPYKETIVSEMSVQNVRSIYEARALIEPHVIVALTPLLTDSDFAELEAILDRSEQAMAAEDFPLFFALNTEYHGFYVRRHGNDIFQNVLKVINGQMERVRMISATIRNHPQKQLAEHRQIFEAIRAGDAQRAGDAMRAHIVGYLDDVLTEFESGRITWFSQEEDRGT
ncbi:MAG: hypothetical protein QOF33_1072 [Thermomicrobiales bacterium]|jgi:DNA-binding GntR family transcriptional regulator|nr:hypothetical protein [Thermomicrobiales bacterium]MEA2582987.1 hypothetical protein [Thermomicrobiales bacterium]